ncbi:hypothetical protein ACXGQW_00800 [Wenyingzhuangia sp. IMCC45533]
MKIKSTIEITDKNKQILIDILEKNDFTVTDTISLKFKNSIKTYAKRTAPRFKPTIAGEYNKNNWKIEIDSIILNLLYSVLLPLSFFGQMELV